MSEIQAISKCAATGRKETLARDVFVFACLTGLTCTELRLLRPLDIEDDWIIVSSGSRTRKVPILPQARLLLDSYLQTANITLFPKIYPHKINRFLKEIARKSNLLREIRVIKYKNNEELDVTTQAYKLLTLSIARKTFIELALEKGIDPIIVSSAAGYKSMNTVSMLVKKMDNRKIDAFKKFGI